MPGTERLRAALAERYQIERELGSGGMATVYLARDLKHDREVALKVLRSDLSAVIGTERFLSEVRITARLDHPHILTLIDSGEADGILYYVLPYVRGESLRVKLDREKQLSVDEAISITKQVASALDYAHGHGVVHRDIKPENILLHEGEAVLADFGIALAVKEAGGNRLTETGLSLGTPQYMSPEQATGDRALDKRSDIYSLAAVFYEMLGGEPPVTGGTAQAMVAKLLTEKPVKLRVLRDTIPPEMEAATEKGLAKVPADRFQSAGDFVRALEKPSPAISKSNNKPRLAGFAVAGILFLLVAFAITKLIRQNAPARNTVTLRDRVQLTNTGNAFRGTISDDGKLVAYAQTDCGTTGCRYSIQLMDVGGTGSRKVFEGATALYGLTLSPDRRNLLMVGSINGVYGSWLISLVGGAPHYIGAGYASFYAAGDSLLFGRIAGPRQKSWLLVSGIDGIPTDSIPISLQTDGPMYPAPIPGSERIALKFSQHGTTHLAIVERNGTEISSFVVPTTGAGAFPSHDAFWLFIPPAGAGSPQIARVPFDTKTMKLATASDTVYSGPTTSIGITADGANFLYDDGTTDYSAWTLPLGDMFFGKFPDAARIIRATGAVRGSISPDGKVVAIGRDDARGGRSFIVVRSNGEQIQIPGRHHSAVPIDSMTLKITEVTDSSTTLYLYDYATKRRRSERTIKGSYFPDMTRAGDAWAWIPADGTSLMIQKDDEPRPRRINLPKWYKNLIWLSGNHDGSKIAFIGWQAPTEDSLGIGVFSVPDGKFTQAFATFGEGGGTSWMNDGSLVVSINDTPESVTLYQLKDGESPKRLGSTPRMIPGGFLPTVTSDMKTVFVITVDDRRDLWLSKVAH